MKKQQSEIMSRALKDLAADDRPREKALRLGVEALTPTELLAILIGSGTPGESVVLLSQRILQHYDGSLKQLAMASVDELKSLFKGVGNAKAITVKAAIRLAQLYSEEQYDIKQIRTPDDAYKLMLNTIQSLPHEEFWVVYLNNANKVIAKDCISKGGLTTTTVDLRLILKSAIVKGATSMILYHNHPSGMLKPSAADDSLTKSICDAAKIVNIKVVDHIIIGNSGYYSYQSEGRI